MAAGSISRDSDLAGGQDRGKSPTRLVEMGVATNRDARDAMCRGVPTATARVSCGRC